jgi:hypothetical protein
VVLQIDVQDDDQDLFGGLRIVTPKEEERFNAAKRRKVVFEQHRREAKLMFERHTQEEKDLAENPGLNLYH